MSNWLERHFRLRENHTTVRTELLGGATTFMTMSYIIFVQPAILSQAGMDKGAVMAATCIASAVATLLTGLLAKVMASPLMGALRPKLRFAWTPRACPGDGKFGHAR